MPEPGSIPLYVLYKGAAAMAKSLESAGGSDMRDFVEFFKHTSMPLKDENILVFGPEEGIAAVEENLNDEKKPLSKGLLVGIPKNSFFYGGYALKEDSLVNDIEFLNLADCLEDAEIVNFGIERSGKGALRLAINVVYKNKDVAQARLSEAEDFVAEWLDEAEQALDEAEQIVDALKKITVKRDGKAVRVELVIHFKDIQEDFENILEQILSEFDS